MQRLPVTARMCGWVLAGAALAWQASLTAAADAPVPAVKRAATQPTTQTSPAQGKWRFPELLSWFGALWIGPAVLLFYRLGINRAETRRITSYFSAMAPGSSGEAHTYIPTGRTIRGSMKGALAAAVLWLALAPVCLAFVKSISIWGMLGAFFLCGLVGVVIRRIDLNNRGLSPVYRKHDDDEDDDDDDD